MHVIEKAVAPKIRPRDTAIGFTKYEMPFVSHRLHLVRLHLILKRIDNDIVNDMLKSEPRREERCKHELIEHPIPGGQKTLRTSR